MLSFALFSPASHDLVSEVSQLRYEVLLICRYFRPVDMYLFVGLDLKYVAQRYESVSGYF